MKFFQPSLPSLISLSLFSSCVTSYRIIEYQGNQCNSASMEVFRLAGPSPCQKLDVGVAQSVLVKVDNVNDNKYDVVLYSSENCDDQVVGMIHNTNGCLPVDSPPFGKAKSVRVVATSSQTKREEDETDLDLEYNMESISEGTIQSPISPGVFATVKLDDHDEDGFFHGEGATTYMVPDPELSKGTSQLRAVPNDTITPMDLRYEFCRFANTCLSLFEPLAAMDASVWIGPLSDRIGSTPWSQFKTGVTVLVGTFNTGASMLTYYASFKTTGSHNSECDTTYTSGAIVKDGMEAQLEKGQNFTDIVMEFCANNKDCFSFAAYLFAQNQVRGGSCPGN